MASSNYLTVTVIPLNWKLFQFFTYNNEHDNRVEYLNCISFNGKNVCLN